MGLVHESFQKDRQDRISIAKDLGYSKSVISKLKAAKTETELTNIMISARKAM